MQKNQIILEINNYLSGIAPSQCYVGITNDIERRLFQEHSVKKDGTWIYAPAENEESAREIEKYFLDNGMEGDTGGGKTGCKIVYAYLKTPQTNQ